MMGKNLFLRVYGELTLENYRETNRNVHLAVDH